MAGAHRWGAAGRAEALDLNGWLETSGLIDIGGRIEMAGGSGTVMGVLAVESGTEGVDVIRVLRSDDHLVSAVCRMSSLHQLT